MAEETPELYLSLKKTEKTKGEFKKEYNEIRQRLIAEGKFKSTDKGLNPAILTEMGEFPYWKRGRSNQGPVPLGEGEYHQMSGGEARPFSARKASQSKATKIRTDRLKKANELMIAAGFGEEVKLGRSKFDKTTKTPEGMAWDHKWEVQEFGPKYDRLIEDFASGSINEKEFKSRLSAHIKKNPGDIQRNLELKSQKDNLAKEASTRALMKQEALADKYAVKDAKYTAFQQLDEATKEAKLKGAHQQALALTQYANNKYKVTKVVDRTNGNGNGVNGNGKNGKSLVNKLGGVRRADQGVNFALQLAQGNYGGAATSATTITAGELLKTKAGQKAIARQVGKIAAKQGGKTALKLIPGMDIYISGREAWDYLRRGRYDQAGIAALSGAIGWIPGAGDVVSAGLDLTNTGISLKRGDYDLLADTDTDTDTNKTKVKGRTKVVRRTKL